MFNTSPVDTGVKFASHAPVSSRLRNDKKAVSAPNTTPANTLTATCWRMARVE
ncbi:MAG: hypothetical protein ABL885_12370 [Methylophilaceae bacterium]